MRSPSSSRRRSRRPKTVRVNMTIPEEELDRIDKFAADHGYTRSGFLLHAAKRMIGAVTARQTSEPPLTREEWRTHDVSGNRELDRGNGAV